MKSFKASRAETPGGQLFWSFKCITNEKYYEILTMLEYLNDLFEIKWIFLQSEPYVAAFSLCMDTTFFTISRF